MRVLLPAQCNKRSRRLGCVVFLGILAASVVLPAVAEAQSIMPSDGELISDEVSIAGEEQGLWAFMIAASIMWLVLLSISVFQFRRQRRLAQELAGMEQSLKDLNASGDRAEE